MDPRGEVIQRLLDDIVNQKRIDAALREAYDAGLAARAEKESGSGSSDQDERR